MRDEEPESDESTPREFRWGMLLLLGPVYLPLLLGALVFIIGAVVFGPIFVTIAVSVGPLDAAATGVGFAAAALAVGAVGWFALRTLIAMGRGGSASPLVGWLAALLSTMLLLPFLGKQAANAASPRWSHALCIKDRARVESLAEWGINVRCPKLEAARAAASEPAAAAEGVQHPAHQQ